MFSVGGIEMLQLKKILKLSTGLKVKIRTCLSFFSSPDELVSFATLVRYLVVCAVTVVNELMKNELN